MFENLSLSLVKCKTFKNTAVYAVSGVAAGFAILFVWPLSKDAPAKVAESLYPNEQNTFTDIFEHPATGLTLAIVSYGVNSLLATKETARQVISILDVPDKYALLKNFLTLNSLARHSRKVFNADRSRGWMIFEGASLAFARVCVIMASVSAWKLMQEMVDAGELSEHLQWPVSIAATCVSSLVNDAFTSFLWGKALNWMVIQGDRAYIRAYHQALLTVANKQLYALIADEVKRRGFIHFYNESFKALNPADIAGTMQLYFNALYQYLNNTLEKGKFDASLKAIVHAPIYEAVLQNVFGLGLGGAYGLAFAFASYYLLDDPALAGLLATITWLGNSPLYLTVGVNVNQKMYDFVSNLMGVCVGKSDAYCYFKGFNLGDWVQGVTSTGIGMIFDISKFMIAFLNPIFNLSPANSGYLALGGAFFVGQSTVNDVIGRLRIFFSARAHGEQRGTQGYVEVGDVSYDVARTAVDRVVSTHTILLSNWLDQQPENSLPNTACVLDEEQPERSGCWQRFWRRLTTKGDDLDVDTYLLSGLRR